MILEERRDLMALRVIARSPDDAPFPRWTWSRLESLQSRGWLESLGHDPDSGRTCWAITNVGLLQLKRRDIA